MLWFAVRLVVAVLVLVLVVRWAMSSMRGYVYGAMAEDDQRERGPEPTIEVAGDVHMRCETCGFEVKLVRLPASDEVPYQLKPLSHCREEMIVFSDAALRPDPRSDELST